MSHSVPPLRRLVHAALALGAALAVTLGSADLSAAVEPADDTSLGKASSTAETSPVAYTDGTYIVQVAGAPVGSYAGGDSGFAATRPAEGERVDAGTPTAQRYAQHLKERQNRALRRVGATAKRQTTVAFNGFTAELSAKQAASLAADPDVLAVTKDALRTVTTDLSDDFLGMDALWRQSGGRERAGRGIVVGVLDTGIWPESESFNGRGWSSARRDFRGTCQTGEEFTRAHCNGKIIGARYYVDGFGTENLADGEFLSPRDGDGHGSHTASTAAGNVVQNVTVDGKNYGTISGMAPGAQISVYKVCWTGRTDDGCATSDMVAAIDDAVADRVDVINFSIGSSSESPVYDPVEIAFLNAAAAGVFVSASAGNSGPNASTLDHPSPWLTTVAASTHRNSDATLTLGNGATYLGASNTSPLPTQTPMALAGGPLSGAATPEQLCYLGTLDPAEVSGKLVVCLRGGNARVEKSAAVEQAGGVGMVLINQAPGESLVGDLHAVPTIHLPSSALQPVTAYVTSTPAPTGAITLGAPAGQATPIPQIAGSSSRGPSVTTGGDILKPDLAAPGVDVLAAVTPFNNDGRAYSLLSGTSMAAPHVAGVAAVLMAENPRWSPMAVKSALMTSARDMAAGTTSPFAQGAGNLQPPKAAATPVVFDHGFRDWIGYLLHEELLDPADWPGYAPVPGTQLNQASIAQGDVVASTTVTRTLTNVTNKRQRLEVTAQVPGFTVTAQPAVVDIRSRGTATVTLTFTRTDAALGQWATGHVRFGSEVRLPVALRPLAAASDKAEIDATGTSGSDTVTITPGFSGTMRATVAGLAGTTPVAESVTADPGAFDPNAPADTGDAVDTYDVTVPAGSALARFQVDGADADDLDLWVYRQTASGWALVGYSATGSADEEVTFRSPAAGTYRAFVHGYAAASGAYTMRNWVVPSAPAGNLTVTPAEVAVRQRQPQVFTLTWSGLAAEQDYLGLVTFADAQGQGTSTIVEIR